jgi:hypothetical protein
MYRWPTSRQEVEAALFLGRCFPEKYYLKELTYLEGMCTHIELIERKTKEVVLPETVLLQFGKYAWEIQDGAKATEQVRDVQESVGGLSVPG